MTKNPNDLTTQELLAEQKRAKQPAKEGASLSAREAAVRHNMIADELKYRQEEAEKLAQLKEQQPTDVREKGVLAGVLGKMQAQYDKDNGITPSTPSTPSANNDRGSNAIATQTANPPEANADTTKTAPKVPTVDSKKLDDTLNNAEVLNIGSTGEGVAALQKQLGIEADGIFGAQTAAAVKAFQEKNQYKIDGIVGPETLRGIYTSSVVGVDLKGAALPKGVTGGQNVDSTSGGQVFVDNRSNLNKAKTISV